MNAFRSVFAWLAWAVATAVLGTVALFVVWLPPRGRFMQPLAHAWSWVFLKFAGIEVTAEGPPIPADRPVVYLVNHESLLDIPVIFSVLPRPARFLAKRILFYIPFVGWNMWLAGFIPIDRGNRRKAVKAFEAAANRMKEGFPILVFPEETRSPDGILLPFQKGGFLLAMKAQIPVVPIGIDGTRECLRKGGIVVTPGRVRVRWGEAIETAGMHHKERDVLIARVRAAMQELRGGGEMIPKNVATSPGKAELAAWAAGEGAAAGTATDAPPTGESAG